MTKMQFVEKTKIIRQDRCKRVRTITKNGFLQALDSYSNHNYNNLIVQISKSIFYDVVELLKILRVKFDSSKYVFDICDVEELYGIIVYKIKN